MLEQIKKESELLASNSQLKEFHTRLSRNSSYIEIRGKRALDFTNWDILNLGSNKKIIKAFQSELEQSGLGVSASRLGSGTLLAHVACEKRLAEFFHTQSALLFSSKNQVVF